MATLKDKNGNTTYVGDDGVKMQSGKTLRQAVKDGDIGGGGSDIEIVDNLNSTDATKVLSAKQGKVLNDSKQAKLIAGSGIRIVNNTISADGSGSTSLALADLRKFQFLPDFYSYYYGKSNGWFERFRLMHFSDVHQNLDNVAEALKLADGIVNVIVNTGDDATGMPSKEAATTIAQLQGYADTVEASIPSSCKLINVQGNHDNPNLTKTQYYDVIGNLVSAHNSSFVFGDSGNHKMYGYMDITPNSTIGTIRIITLDPFDDENFSTTYYWNDAAFTQEQIDWLIAILKEAATAGYKVITAMHYSFGDNTVWEEDGISANPDVKYCQSPFMIPDIIEAFQNQATLSTTYKDSVGSNNITIDEDLSSYPKLHYICHLFGHIHSKNAYQCQKTDGSKKYDMLMLGEHNMGSIGTAINKVKLHSGTINSIKLSVLEIDTVSQCIYRVSYGGYTAYNMSETARTVKISYRFNS